MKEIVALGTVLLVVGIAGVKQTKDWMLKP